MLKTMKRGAALLMALVLCLSLLPVTRAAAADAAVEYVYDSTGKYIYNWGTRGEVATSLSPNAEAFYTGDSTYDVLSVYKGGTGVSDAPQSALYAELQTLMKTAHSHETSYAETRDLYQYTDCQNSGKDSKAISSFYSGKAIGPAWDGGATWNREHTWPNSKGAGGNDENDIMMLRPTASTENGARGNMAYGEGAGYFDPNADSNHTLDLRGDVARIFLYTYVRWGVVNGNGEYDTWGTNGVIESLEVLLKWMELDPVDTWELGRNDSVQAITGTRNVFVDYPELAFLLYGAEIPGNMITPSGEAMEAPDHTHNFVAGTPTPATCTAEGYTTYTCTICGKSYKGDKVPMLSHNYKNGVCTGCGAAEPVELVVIENPVAGTAYKFGMIQKNVSATDVYYLDGGKSSYYMSTTKNSDAAIDVYLEKTTGGYYFYTILNGTKTYINMVVSGTHVNGAYEATASTVYSLSTESKTIVANVNNDFYWFGTRNDRDFTTVGPCATSYNGFYCQFYGEAGGSGEAPAPECKHTNTTVQGAVEATCTEDGYTGATVCSDCGDIKLGETIPALGHNYVNGICSRCGAAEPTGFGIIDVPVAGTAYKFGMIQQNVSATDVYYLAGGMSSYYMATTTDKAAAIDVYLEETAGGYYFYTMINGVKTYINMVVSGTHVNGAYEAKASTVYTYDAASKTIIAQVNNASYWFGTRNDKTYTTVGPCATSYNGFYCQFYGERGGSGETPAPDVPEQPNPDPDTPVANKADFETISSNGDSGYNNTYTTKNGWKTVNSAIQTGGSQNSNPQFTVIGPDKTYKAVCMNGKTSAPGKITSPTLTGGISKLTMRYTKMFTDTKLSATITITDLTTGATYTKTVARDVAKDTDKYVVWDFEWVLETPVVGDFTIEVVNNCPSKSTSNKDRLTVLELAWASAEPECKHTNTTVEGAKEATCSEDGHTGKTVCADCGETVSEGEVIPAPGHSYENGVCANCGEKDPDAPAVNRADFETIVTSNANGDSSYTKTFTTKNGWKTVNSAIQAGGPQDNNPQFTVIGPDNTHKAVCMNGKTSAPGKITSPTLTGGISKLTMRYTKMFTDTKLSATITITDLTTGATYTKTVARTVDKNADKYVVWDFEWILETPVVGDFTIEVVNNCPSKSTSNKDRLTVLELAWVSAEAEPECKHTNTTIEGAKEATCTEDGHTGKTVCADCGETVSKGEVIPALDHDLIQHPAQAPTYSEIGWEAYETCSRCDYSTYVELPVLPIPLYTIAVTSGENGKVTAQNLYAAAGTSIKVSAVANEGYKVLSLTVTDAAGKEIEIVDGKFKMPASKVTVSATFIYDLPYTDVADDAENYAAIAYMYENGLMIGTSTEGYVFDGDKTMTRAQIAMILYRLAGEPETACAGTFTDAPEGTWYTEAVEWAASKGIINGVGDDSFAPGREITVVELAALTYRYAQCQQSGKCESADWATESAAAMTWCVENGVLSEGIDTAAIADRNLAAEMFFAIDALIQK